MRQQEGGEDFRKERGHGLGGKQGGRGHERDKKEVRFWERNEEIRKEMGRKKSGDRKEVRSSKRNEKIGQERSEE